MGGEKELQSRIIIGIDGVKRKETRLGWTIHME